MKLTKNKEREILKVYDTWLHGYLNGDLETYNYFLDKDYHFIGSTNNEEFLNRKDTIRFFKKTAYQLDGKTDIRNDIKIIDTYGELVFITHLLDAWFLVESQWNFYGRFRFTNVLHETKAGWRFIYQHYSTPDAKAGEEDTIGYAQINAENQQLREAISRRTRELEEKNRELEIETALEKVRAVAMGMQKPEDLSTIGKTVFNELRSLGFYSIRNTEIVINSEDKEAVKSYHYSDYGKDEVIEINYQENPIVKKWANDLKKANDIFVPVTIREKQMKEWKAYRKKLGYKSDPKMTRAKTVHYYSYSTGLGALSISTWEKLSKEQIQIMGRFRNVFKLSYKRYIDITNAEAQAREAQIEAALERVRSRSMAMHKSDELLEVSCVLFEEFRQLGQPADQLSIGIMNEADGVVEICATVKGQKLPRIFSHSIDEPYVMKKVFSGWKTGDGSLNLELSSRELSAYNRYRNQIVGREMFATQVDPKQKRVIYASYFSRGMLAIGVSGQLPDEIRFIMNRFASVFEQTYTRFLDLQKAEAQAKEAKLESALERVRSRSLAMHHSSELSSVVDTLLREFTNLEFSLTFCIINLIDEQDRSNTVWAANPETGKDPESYYMKFEDYPFHHAMWDAWKSQKKHFIYTIEGEEKKIYDEYLFTKTEFRRFPKHVQDANKALKRYVAGFTFFKYSGLQTVSENQISEEELKILERFGRVFEQSYTRFLDLKKAEAQAREAQIEAALEKVRSRTMGMQHSEELMEAANLLFRQVEGLGVPVFGCGFNIWDEDRKFTTAWMSGKDRIQAPFKVSSSEDIFIRIYDANDRGEALFVEEQAGEALTAHYAYMNSLPVFNEIANKMAAVGQTFPTFQIMHCAFFSQGYLMFITYEPVPDAYDIFKRFAKVFEQTYTRFLDLQKAEAQAREAEIQLALERARSQSMTMQHSAELDNTLRVFHEQVIQLGIGSSFSFLWLPEEEKDRHIFWAAWAENNATTFKSKAVNYPLDRNEPATAQCLVDWKGKEPVVSYHVPPAGVESYFAAWSELIAGVEELIPENFTEGLYYVEAFNKYGCFGVVVTSELKEAEKKILYRFATEFESTYTRFLDLQKAEAQAREAQIEAALERIRAHSIGMRSTGDFGNVTTEMFNQLRSFGEDLYAAGIVFCDKHEGYVEQWHSIPGGGMLSPFIVPIDLDYIHQYRYDQWKAGKNVFSIEIPGHFIEQHFKDIFNLPSAQVAIRDLASRNAPMPEIPKWEIDYGASFRNGYILISSLKYLESTEILPRFAKVFEQAYTRFLDLQKAEEQAREAQVESALERIRGKVTSMQESSELLDIVVSMRREFVTLGHEADYFWYMRWLPEKYQKAMTSGDGTRIGMIMELPRHIHGDIPLLANWERSDEPAVVYAMDVDAAVDYVDKMIRLGDFEQVDHNAPTLDDIRHIGGLTFVMARTSHGEIGYSLAGAVPNPPAEAMATLVRFAGVFDLAYRRFEDLKLAEKRNRETQIELALERVRSRSMAMHKSDELLEAGEILCREMGKLGIACLTSGFVLMDKEEKIGWNYTPHPGSGKIMPQAVGIPHTETKEMRKTLESWKKQEPVCILELDEEETIRHQTFIATRSIHFPLSASELIAISPPRLVLHNFNFQQGYLLIVGGEKLSQDQMDIMLRFTHVFQQTYTRFLDLKKAEAQALQAERDLVEIKAARKKAEETLSELQSTQKQLIQSEKMASLGELTAGIAHEIQNPLNFVNNFSDVSHELLDEMKEELTKGNLEDAMAIAEDVKKNLEKINHHGKRADAIVKGMLQHSRSGSGQKEPTDINALCDEYLRLAYHGLRAKDKSFQSGFEANLDPGVGKISVMPQEMGRVILNLINNAFYAVADKKKTAGEGYNPMITVTTRNLKDKVEIEVKDNGNGIPEEIREKIFQPFFTTKPSGQGTGLGLSLSYDIVRAHGGDLKVESGEGEGAAFILTIPT
ncbi:MAG: ATP-binding protein [Chitinophagaceae bacterium]